jgi:predicted RNA binding protein YcfA (HicA-like mRNA interferase family)
LNKKCYALFKRAKTNPEGLSFKGLKSLCECAGLMCVRVKGSHHIYRRNDPFYLISIQKMKDQMAKPYQVRQLLEFVEENGIDILE